MATELENFLIAPESGLFETLVDLGQRVESGEPVAPDPLPRAAGPGAGADPREERRHRLRRRAVATMRAGRQPRRGRARGRPLGARLTERFTVAATQVDVRHLDVEHNLETHLRLIAETAEAGCDLVVFPETSVTGNNGSPEVTRFAGAARRAHLPHDPRAGEGVAGSSSRTGSASSTAARTTTRRRSSGRTA